MKTVKEVSKLTGISVKALHHYDAIDLLKPTKVTEAGYRLYDDHAVEQLCQIAAYREIGFSLKEIRPLLQASDHDRNRALEQQIRRMQNTVARLQTRIHFAKGIHLGGMSHMNWTNFDARQIDDYSAQAEALYGKTEAYREFKDKSRSRSDKQEQDLGIQLMDFFVRLGSMKLLPPDSDTVQTWVSELQAFLTDHYYRCTPQILEGLGEMYAGGGSMTENIDEAGGKGTGEFARQAIRIYCSK